MSTNRLDRTFRLAFIRRKIGTTFKSQAVRTALLTELNTRGPDSEVIVRMVEKIPTTRQAVVQPVWPFGIQLSVEQKLINEALDCLDSLDSYLQFEEWEMDQIEAQEEADDDDDDVDLVSEDEGYNTEDDDDIVVDQWNFGIAPMLWHIQL